MQVPVVSVICVCYNQGRFVSEAITSVLRQSYPRVQLVVVDDGSQDNSVETIRACVDDHPEIAFLPLSENSGYCKAFNEALRHATGAFVIDLAADDILAPERIKKAWRRCKPRGNRTAFTFATRTGSMKQVNTCSAIPIAFHMIPFRRVMCTGR